uniref:hypothetical protein n=1 Tax=Nocardia wallacei TaxID=480035 RepID=UPI00245700D0
MFATLAGAVAGRSDAGATAGSVAAAAAGAVAAARGEQSPPQAVAANETLKLPPGLDTNDASLRMADQLFGAQPE